MKSILLFVLSLFLFSAQAQVTFTLVSIPDYTPEEDQIYIAGSFNGWNPGDDFYVLEENNDGLWEITLDGFSDGETIEFKFTRGSWETVEKGPDDEEIPNRTFTFGNGEMVEITIHNWADNNGGGGNSTAAENVHVVDESFYMPQLDRYRRIWIYLPPDYEDTQDNYPVIYMHDGQNLFDVETAFMGEWEVDETLNELAAEGFLVPIVVGIDNGGAHRANEYLPYYNENLNGGGEGDEYMAFIVETLKPFIDEEYRTLTDRENTGIIGSSFGGVISFYGAVKYQDVFSKSGPFSPAYWANYEELFDYLSETGYQEEVRFYQNAGELEGDQYIAAMYQMEDALIDEGFANVYSTVIAEGNHNEETWAGDFENAYLWLFAEYSITSIDEVTSGLKPMVYPNPVKDILNIRPGSMTGASKIKIFDLDGALVKESNSPGKSIEVNELKPGLYFIHIDTESESTIESFIKL